MAIPGFGSIRQKAEESYQFVTWLVGEIHARNWDKILIFCAVTAAALLNPGSFKTLYPWLMGQDVPDDFPPAWYPVALWSLVALLFLSALIIAFLAKARDHQIPLIDLSERSAIKGLRSFTYEDADVFKRLGRTYSLHECLDAVTDPEFRFGILSGESGCGKTSFVQAGLWPGLETRGFHSIYVKLTERDPVDAIRQAFVQQKILSREQAYELDFFGLLDAALVLKTQSTDNNGVVLVLDQFEQFFVHQRIKEDRKPFFDALTAWYRLKSGHPVRILISIRSDYVGRLVELQKAMGYSLGPNENFRLDMFEPKEAVEVFRVLAETENLGFDEGFVKELTEQELASHEDGLVSLVDLQILAWMIKAQKDTERKAFDRTTYQKLGGVEKLLERFLQRVLQARETEARRQAAVKVLLALVDLDSNIRAGVLTLPDLQKKLSGSLTAEDAKEAVQWLSRGDIRLVTPRPQEDEQGYELAHERIIPALRRLAGKTLSEADTANQLLDRRVNEWMGNQRSSRYLLNWGDLRLIQKQKPYLVWGTKRPQKEALIAKSRRRRNHWLAAAGAVAVVAVSLTALYCSDRGQICLMERDLRLLVQKTRDPALLRKSALAFFARNHFEDAFGAVDRIQNPQSKAETLQALAETVLKLDQPEQAAALLEGLREAATGIENPGFKAQTLRALAEAALKLDQPEQAVALLEAAQEAATEIKFSVMMDKAETLQALAETVLKLDQPEQAAVLLEGLREAATGIEDPGFKAQTLRALAEAALKLDQSDQAAVLLEAAREAATGIEHPGQKTQTLRALAEAALKLDQSDQAAVLLEAAREAATGIEHPGQKTETLQALAETALKLDQSDQAAVLLEAAREAATRIENSWFKAQTLRALAEAALKLDQSDQAAVLLEAAREAATGIEHPGQKTETLQALAEAALKLDQSDQAAVLLEAAREAATGIEDPGFKAQTLRALAEAALKLDQSDQAAVLLEGLREAATGIENPGFKAQTLQALAEAALKLDQSEQAAVLLEGLREAATGIENSWFKAQTLRALAEAALKLDQSDQAAVLLEAAREAATRIKDPGFKAGTLRALAEAALKLDQSEQAVALLEGMRETATGIEHPFLPKAVTLLMLAKAVLKLDQPDQAALKLDQSEQVAVLLVLLEGLREAAIGIEDPWFKARTLQALAEAALKLDQSEQVAVLLEGLREAATGIEYPWQKAVTLRTLAEAALKLDQPEQAVVLLEAAREAATRIKDSGYEPLTRMQYSFLKARTLQVLAEAALELDQPDQAAVLLEAAREAATRIEYSVQKAEILQVLTQVALKLDQPEQAVVLLEAAREAATRIKDPGFKAGTLLALAEAALELDQSEQAVVLLEAAQEAATGIENSGDKAETLQALAEMAAKGEVWHMAREIVHMIPSADERIQALSQILMIWAEKETLPAATQGNRI